MKKNNKKGLIISLSLMIMIGIIVGVWFSYKESQKFEYEGEDLLKDSVLTKEEMDKARFVDNIAIINIYMDDKQIIQYKANERDEVTYIVNNIYSRIRTNKAVKKSDIKYDIRIKFDKKRSFYLNTRKDKRKAMFDNNGKLYTCVLKEEEYENLEQYLDISNNFRNNFR